MFSGIFGAVSKHMAVTAISRANLAKMDSARSAALAEMRRLKDRTAREVAESASNEKNLVWGVKRQLTANEWRLIYTSEAFTGWWQVHYESIFRDLKAQYAPGNKIKGTSQYRILIQRVAALATMVAMMEANGVETGIRLDFDGMLLKYIAQLQRYTESEKREVTVRSEAVQKAMILVVGLAEATIGDPAARGAFLRALTYKLQGVEGIDPLLVGPGTEIEETVIETVVEEPDLMHVRARDMDIDMGAEPVVEVAVVAEPAAGERIYAIRPGLRPVGGNR